MALLRTLWLMHHSNEWLPEPSPCLLHLNQVIPVYLCIVQEEGEGTRPMNSAYFFSLFSKKLLQWLGASVQIQRLKFPLPSEREGMHAHTDKKKEGRRVKQIKEILYTNVENVCMYFPHMYSLYLPTFSLSASLFSLIAFFFPVGRTLLNKHS